LLIEEKIAQGMSRDDARRAARLELGPVDQVKEHVRDVRAGARLDVIRQDVRFGVRTLSRRPGFAILAVLTLGVGMGATTAIFSLIDSVLLKPLPFHEPDRLVMVWQVRPRFNLPRIEAAPLNYLDWQQQVRAVESLAAYVGGFLNLTGPARQGGCSPPRRRRICSPRWVSNRSSDAGSRRPKAPQDRPPS
jgi:hypothetical protein